MAAEPHRGRDKIAQAQALLIVDFVNTKGSLKPTNLRVCSFAAHAVKGSLKT